MKKTLLSPAELEFIKAFESIESVEVIEEYRAYYDENGWVTTFCGSNHPAGDNWISIPKELYITHNHLHLRVVNDKLVKDIPTNKHFFPLTKSNKGVKIVKNHAGLILEPGEAYVDTEYYDKRNN
jgi:hypothetical protein